MLIAQWSNCKESSEITNSCYQNEKTKKTKKKTKKKTLNVINMYAP